MAPRMSKLIGVVMVAFVALNADAQRTLTTDPFLTSRGANQVLPMQENPICGGLAYSNTGPALINGQTVKLNLLAPELEKAEGAVSPPPPSKCGQGNCGIKGAVDSDTQTAVACGAMLLKWSLIDPQLIQFELQTSARGWVGIGIQSPINNDLMDTYQCGYDNAKAQWFVSDGSLHGLSAPLDDTQQAGTNDAVMVSTSDSAEGVRCVFTRKLVTPDAFDVPITKGAFEVSWAFHDSNQNPLTLHSRRGLWRIDFLAGSNALVAGPGLGGGGPSQRKCWGSHCVKNKIANNDVENAAASWGGRSRGGVDWLPDTAWTGIQGARDAWQGKGRAWAGLDASEAAIWGGEPFDSYISACSGGNAGGDGGWSKPASGLPRAYPSWGAGQWPRGTGCMLCQDKTNEDVWGAVSPTKDVVIVLPGTAAEPAVLPAETGDGQFSVRLQCAIDGASQTLDDPTSAPTLTVIKLKSSADAIVQVKADFEPDVHVKHCTLSVFYKNLASVCMDFKLRKNDGAMPDPPALMPDQEPYTPPLLPVPETDGPKIIIGKLKIGQASLRGLFPTSSQNADAVLAFEEGLAQLSLSRYYDYCPATFRKAQELDANFAMAVWGEAMCHHHGIWYENLHGMGKAVVAKFDKMDLTGLSAREQLYVKSVQRLYSDEGLYLTRLHDFGQYFRQIFELNPTDVFAEILVALGTLAKADPAANGFMRRDVLGVYGASETLARLYKTHPDIPLLHHLMIHVHDEPNIASEGVEAAMTFGASAPDDPHAWHMGSHIWCKLGEWAKGVAANEKSLAVEADNSHTTHFMTYFYIQAGHWAKADEQIKKFEAKDNLFARTNGNVLRANFVLDTGVWSDAMQTLPPLDVETSNPEYYSAEYVGTYIWIDSAYGAMLLAQGIVASREKRFAYAQSCLDGLAKLLALQDTLPSPEAQTMLTEYKEQIGMVMLMLQGYMQVKQGAENSDEALQRAGLKQLKFAAAASTALGPTGYGPLQFPPFPPHELYAEVLLSLGSYAEALVHYERSLADSPNRINALLGAGRAAAGLHKQGPRTTAAERHAADAAHYTAAAYHQRLLDMYAENGVTDPLEGLVAGKGGKLPAISPLAESKAYLEAMSTAPIQCTEPYVNYIGLHIGVVIVVLLGAIQVIWIVVRYRAEKAEKGKQYAGIKMSSRHQEPFLM